jgi:hypothetical protein
MKLPKILMALALPSLLAFGCSSGDAPSLDEEQVGEVAQAIGEASCGTLNEPHATFSGSIAYNASGSVSPASYTHSKCYKAYVVRINNYSALRPDIIAADSKLTSSTWQPPPPPSSGSPSFPTNPDVSLPSGPLALPLGKAECEERFMRAILYKNGAHFKTREAHGVYRESVNFYTRCQLPYITFGGQSDNLSPGSNYTVAVTYRVKDASAAATLPVRIVTPPVSCGGYNQACCTSGSACEAWTECKSYTCAGCGYENEPGCTYAGAPASCISEELELVNGVCKRCGDEGQPACIEPSSNTKYCYSAALKVQRGICKSCGAEGETCCDKYPMSGPDYCDAGKKCDSNNTCRTPQAPQPGPCDNCGQGDYATCCAASCPLRCKVTNHACHPGSNSPSDDYCLSVPIPSPDAFCTSAVTGECYDVWDMLSVTSQTGITETACGQTLEQARARALFLLAQSVSLTTLDNPGNNSCLYYFTN